MLLLLLSLWCRGFMALLICMLVAFICPAKLWFDFMTLYSLFTARLRFGDGMGPGIGLCCLFVVVLLWLVVVVVLLESLF